MELSIFNWIMSIPSLLGQFSSWLFTELPYIHLTPIAIFSIGGITLLLGLHLAKLINPIS